MDLSQKLALQELYVRAPYVVSVGALATTLRTKLKVITDQNDLTTIEQ